MHKNWVWEKNDQSVTCLADDPRNLETRNNRRRTPGILSQTNKLAYNQYSSNAQVKLEWKIQISKRSFFLSPFDFRCFFRVDSFCKPDFLSWTFWLDLSFEFYLCIRLVLILCLFVCDRVPGVCRLLLRIARFCGSSARQVTLWSYPVHTQFYCIRSVFLKHCMIRI